MALSLTTFIIIICVMIISIIFKPTIKIGNKIELQTYWIITLVGAIFVLITNQINFNNLLDNMLNGSMNPIKILILFICLSMISICLDELNFFNYLSSKVLNISKGSQYKIFFSLYILVGLLTIFTSNDIVILTLTPFIILFSKKANINPLPYLICEFVNANTYSMLLSISNPTNIYLSSILNISFVDYLSKMLLASLLGGLSSLIVILLIFRKDLSKKIENIEINQEKIKNKPLVIINLIILGITTLMLIVSNYINIEMWLICLAAALLLSVILFIYTLKSKDKTYLFDTYKRLPYNLIPFILSMFILVFSLKENGVTIYLKDFLNYLSINKYATAFTYTISSVLFDNIINNIPMSVLFSSLLDTNNQIGVYATIIGSNIGAYLTPIGALAGIMWMSILKRYNLDFNFISFIKYGLIIVPAVIIFSCLGLIVLF